VGPPHTERVGAAGWDAEERARGLTAPTAGGAPQKSIWRRRLAWQVMAYMGIGSLVFYGPLSWLPEIYRSRGVDPATAGYLLLVMNFVGMIGSLVAPLFAGKVRDQRTAVIVSAGLTLVGFFGLLLGPTAIAFFWMALVGLGTGAQFGLALLFIVLRSADGHVAARLSSMAQSGGYLIAATGPLVMGLLHSLTKGWFASVAFLIVATAVGLVAGYGAARDTRRYGSAGGIAPWEGAP
jgi:CP family cyanate transporter-like MFS transporter